MDENVRRWWVWFGVALFLLVPLDLLTTLVAVTRHGIGVEANPFVRWLLGEGLVAVASANIAVAGLAVVLFHAAMRGIASASSRYHRPLTRVVNVWVGTLLLAGVALLVNNLLVVV